MIYGIGSDIVSIIRIENIIERWGEALAARVLTVKELQEYRRSRFQPPYLAKHLAAKEAAAKALGSGFRGGLAMSHIGIDHDPMGKPTLYFLDKAAAIIERNRIVRMHLSISDEREYATAFVTLEVE